MVNRFVFLKQKISFCCPIRQLLRNRLCAIHLPPLNWVEHSKQNSYHRRAKLIGHKKKPTDH